MTHDTNQRQLRPEVTTWTVLQREKLNPVIQCMPWLPAVDWTLIGQHAPLLVDTPPDSLPEADVVIITWAPAQQAAMPP